VREDVATQGGIVSLTLETIMSLDFDYSKCKDWRAASTDPIDPERWHPVGNALVWASIPCGFNTIREDNVDRIWTRIAVMQALGGAFLGTSDGPLYLTRDDVVRYIGLSTNASAKTDAEFYMMVAGTVRDGNFGHNQKQSAFDFIAERAKKVAKKKAKK
jgi:hypothetical protein